MLEASLSQALRLENARGANGARITLGRTCPKGVVGVMEDLRKRLGRDPDPDEVGTKMHRDKGYDDKNKRVKEEGKQRLLEALQDSEKDEELSDYHRQDDCTDHMAASSARCVTLGTSLTPAMEHNMFDPEYVASMQKELAELKAIKEATVARRNGGAHERVHVAHCHVQKDKDVDDVLDAERGGRRASITRKRKDPHDQYFKHLVSRYAEVQSVMPTELHGVVGRCVAELNSGYIRNDRDTHKKVQDLSVVSEDLLDGRNTCSRLQEKGRIPVSLKKKSRVT